jgi:hypothetical protein
LTPGEDAEHEIARSATAAVLSTGAPVCRASLVLAVVALAGAGLAPALPQPVRVLLGGSLALGLVQAWYALRVAIDARLFALPGLAANLGSLDRILERLRGASPPACRGFAERSGAALRLWRRQVIVAFLQAGCLLAAAAWLLAARQL